MKNFLLIFSILIFVNVLLHGQKDTVYLSKNFKFHDGIYLSFKDFQNNKPSYTWDEVDAGIYSNPQNFMSQMHFLKLKNTDDENGESEEIDLDGIWGISLDGIPYIRLHKNILKKETTVFAGMRLRGKICFFQFEQYVMKKIPISAYNPVTGEPFLTSNVERKVKVMHQYMLDFQTGATAVFSKDNFKNWIEDDRRLYNTVDELTKDEVQQKLFKCLLIYVDRNLVKITK